MKLSKTQRIERALDGITDTAGQLMLWMRQFEAETGNIFLDNLWETIDNIAQAALDFKSEEIPF